jgi:hypothetical protein
MPDPEANGTQGNCREEVAGEFVVACGDAPEVLEFVEEALDEVSLAVEGEIDGTHDLDVALRGDVGGGAAGGEEVDDGPRAVAAVGDGLARRGQAVDQRWQRGLIGGLAGRQDQPDGQAIAIDDRVDFGAQSSARTADGVIRAPFFPPAAC